MPKKLAAWISITLVSLFYLLLGLLHFIEPEFNPAKNLISEYELGPYGWVMSLAFIVLGLAVFTMLYANQANTSNRKYQLGQWWLFLIGVAYLGAGLFYPYQPPNLASLLHGICDILIIATSPIAKTLYSAGLAEIPAYQPHKTRLSRAVILVWLGLLTFMGSTIVFGLMG